MASVLGRLSGAMGLRAATFEEVEHDRSATIQAGVVVAAAHASQALAAVFPTVSGVAVSVAIGLAGWVIGAAVLLVVGTKLLPDKNTEADLGQMLRTVGFAQAAGIFGILGRIPGLYWGVIAFVSLWILVAMVIAVRQALDYTSTTRAIVVCIVAWVIMVAIQLGAGFIGIGAATLSGTVQ